MICSFCNNREVCTDLCPILEQYVDQDTNEGNEILLTDLVDSKNMTNHFEDVYTTVNDVRELDGVDFSKYGIPKRQQLCIELFYFQNRTIGEIARLLHIKPITVKVLKLRGIKRIAEQLGIKYSRMRRFRDSHRAATSKVHSYTAKLSVQKSRPRLMINFEDLQK